MDLEMKNIFICEDGTWSTTTNVDNGKLAPSNVSKIARVIRSTDKQAIFYDRGVGTDGGADTYLGGITGKGLFLNVKQAYKFIVKNYNTGDNIYILGFSRGAYTARVLAGLIGQMGILRKKYVTDIDAVYTYYKDKNIDKEIMRDYSSHFCHSSKKVKFLGVWDTVGSLGIPTPFLGWLTSGQHDFLDSDLSENVENAYQALALDEIRGQFPPSLWQNSKLCKGQVVEQKWFAGAHTNIGGGYSDTGLSDITLVWMLDKIDKAVESTGIKLDVDNEYIKKYVKPDCTGELRDESDAKTVYKMHKTKRIPFSTNAINESLDSSVDERICSKECKYMPMYKNDIEL
jgi:uncharacterized protein (DUF2235 family)